MKDVTIEFFKEYGEQLLHAVYFKDLVTWYGPLFLKWYNEMR